MPRLQTITPPQTVLQPTQSVPVAVPTPAPSSAALPFLVGETPDGLRQAGEGEVRKAYDAVCDSHRARHNAQPPVTVTAIEVWQEVQAQRTRTAQERRREQHERMRRRKKRRDALLGAGSAAIFLGATAFVLRSVRAVEPSVPASVVTMEQTAATQTVSPPVTSAITSTTTPSATSAVTAKTPTFTAATLPNGYEIRVTVDTLMALQGEEKRLQMLPGSASSVTVATTPEAAWQIVRLDGKFYLRAYAAVPQEQMAIFAVPVTLYNNPAHPAIPSGVLVRPISLPVSGLQFNDGFLPTAQGKFAALRLSLRRYDRLFEQPWTPLPL
jgi:hypothetical protein